MVDKSILVKDLCKPMTCSIWNGHFDIPQTQKNKKRMVDKSNLLKDLCKPMTYSVWNGHFDIPHTQKQKDIVWLGFGCKCNQQWLAFWPILINCDCEPLVDGVLTYYSACVHTNLLLIVVYLRIFYFGLMGFLVLSLWRGVLPLSVKR